MPKIVKVLDTEKIDGDVVATTEFYEGDTSENIVYTVPNFQSIPLKDDEILALQLDKSGEVAIALIPLETDINKGETKIVWRDSDGNVKGSLHGKDDGKLAISNETEELITVLSDLLTELLAARVVTALGESPFTTTTLTQLTSIQTRLDTFK